MVDRIKSRISSMALSGWNEGHGFFGGGIRGHEIHEKGNFGVMQFQFFTIVRFLAKRGQGTKHAPYEECTSASPRWWIELTLANYPIRPAVLDALWWDSSFDC
jgi:hypothetical protein